MFEVVVCIYGVLLLVLAGVFYFEFCWDDHGAAPSISGGYGPMHLTDLTPPDTGLGKGDGSIICSEGPSVLHTVRRAAALTRFPLSRVTSDDQANICAGAALLASYQRALGGTTGSQQPIGRWYDAVRRYSESA